MPPAMRLKAVRLPDAPDSACADAGDLGHQVGGPVRCLARRTGQRQRHNVLGHLGLKRWNARGSRLVAQKAIDAFGGKALLPAPDAGLGLARASHDLGRADIIGAQQNDLGTPDMLLRRITICDQRPQTRAIRRRNDEGYSGAHVPDSHTLSRKRIPNRTLMSGGDH